MDLKKIAVAGSLESSDILITIEPSDEKEIYIHLKSSVEKQFGKQIIKTIRETLIEIGVKKAVVRAVDKGALDCVIKARVQGAACRAAGIIEYKW